MSTILYKYLKRIIPKYGLSTYRLTTEVGPTLNYKVFPTYGKLFLTGSCNCTIQPTNLQKFPDANEVFITMPNILKDANSLRIFGENRDEIICDLLNEQTQSNCLLEIPVKYDVNVKLQDTGNLTLSNLESDEIQVSTDKGSIETKSIRCHNIRIRTKSGSIKAVGTLQGSVAINTLQSDISAQKFQGPQLNIQADQLTTHIESLYVDNVYITARMGDLVIKNLHGASQINLQEASVDINGLHGQLELMLTKGVVKLHIIELHRQSVVQVSNGGKIYLSVSDINRYSIELQAPSIIVAKDLQQYCSTTEDRSVIHVNKDKTLPKLLVCVTSGEIQVNCKDWFSSLGIKV